MGDDDGTADDSYGNSATAQAGASNSTYAASSTTRSAPSSQPAGGANLLDLLDDSPAPSPAPAPSSTAGANLASAFASPSSSSSSPSPAKISLVTAEAGQGVFISGVMTKRSGQVVLDLDFGNTLPTPVQGISAL